MVTGTGAGRLDARQAGRCGTRGALSPVGVVAGRARRGRGGVRQQGPLAVTLHALGVGAVERQAVKNLAAMQPPRQASYAEQDVHAPPLWGWRS